MPPDSARARGEAPAPTGGGAAKRRLHAGRPASLAVPLENPDVKGGTVRPADSAARSAAKAAGKRGETEDTAASGASKTAARRDRGPPPLAPPTPEVGLALFLAGVATLVLVLATAHDHDVFWHALDSAVLTVVPQDKSHNAMMALRNASFHISFWAFAATAELGLVWGAYLALLGAPGMWVSVPPSLLAGAAVAVGAFRERPWAEGTWVATTPQAPLVTSVAAAAIGSLFLGRAARHREEQAYIKKRTLWEKLGVAPEESGRTTPTANLISVARTPSPERRRRAAAAAERQKESKAAKNIARTSSSPGEFEFSSPPPPIPPQGPFGATASTSDGAKQRRKKA